MAHPVKLVQRCLWGRWPVRFAGAFGAAAGSNAAPCFGIFGGISRQQLGRWSPQA
jgi:hypothetical protein